MFNILYLENYLPLSLKLSLNESRPIFQNLFSKLFFINILFSVFFALYVYNSNQSYQLVNWLEFCSIGLPLLEITYFLLLAARLKFVKKESFTKNISRDIKLISGLFWLSAFVKLIIVEALTTRLFYAIYPFIDFPCEQNAKYIFITMWQIALASIVLTILAEYATNAVQAVRISKISQNFSS